MQTVTAEEIVGKYGDAVKDMVDGATIFYVTDKSTYRNYDVVVHAAGSFRVKILKDGKTIQAEDLGKGQHPPVRKIIKDWDFDVAFIRNEMVLIVMTDEKV